MHHKYYVVLLPIVFSLHAEVDPEAYHATNVGQFTHAIKELHKLHLTGSEKILDVGSGDGRISRYIAQEYIPNGQLIGIDIQNDMVVFASEHSQSDNVSYRVADVREYIVPNEYDVITSFWTLHWVKEYALALDNIARSLKPDGKALLCHIIGIDPFQKIVNNLLETEKWKKYKSDRSILIHSPSLSRIAHAIEESGLMIDSFEIKKNGSWLPLDIVKHNLLSLPLFDFIPAPMRSEFCDDMLQGFIKMEPLNENNELFQWLPVVAMVLRKAV